MPSPSKNTTIYVAPVMRKLAEVAPHLQPSLRKVADFILRHPLRAATLTIEEMAQETDTSPAAVNRLAKAMNLGGYTGMKAELVATLQQVVSPMLLSFMSESRRMTNLRIKLELGVRLRYARVIDALPQSTSQAALK